MVKLLYEIEVLEADLRYFSSSHYTSRQHINKSGAEKLSERIRRSLAVTGVFSNLKVSLIGTTDERSTQC